MTTTTTTATRKLEIKKHIKRKEMRGFWILKWNTETFNNNVKCSHYNRHSPSMNREISMCVWQNARDEIKYFNMKRKGRESNKRWGERCSNERVNERWKTRSSGDERPNKAKTATTEIKMNAKIAQELRARFTFEEKPSSSPSIRKKSNEHDWNCRMKEENKTLVHIYYVVSIVETFNMFHVYNCVYCI